MVKSLRTGPTSFLRSFLCVLCAFCANPVFQDKYKSISRRRMKKGRLRRDHRVALSRSKLFLRPRDLRLRRDDYVGYTRLILVLFLDYAS